MARERSPALANRDNVIDGVGDGQTPLDMAAPAQGLDRQVRCSQACPSRGIVRKVSQDGFPAQPPTGTAGQGTPP